MPGISGLTALLTGKRLLETGQYKHAIVAGADIISSFILSGFQSFQAISANPANHLMQPATASPGRGGSYYHSFIGLKK